MAHGGSREPPGTGLGEEGLAGLIASTLSVERLEARPRSGWLRGLLAARSRVRMPYAVIIDSDDGARALVLVTRGRVAYTEARGPWGTLHGSQALRMLDEELQGWVRVAYAALRGSAVEWRPEELGTGVKGIDLQHRQLVAALNTLYQGVLLGEPGRALAATLGFLHEYTVHHFRSEEGFFTRHGYPGAEAHVRQHHWFIERVEEYSREARGGDDIGLPVVVFLADWTRRHIAGSDRDWSRWLHEARARGEA